MATVNTELSSVVFEWSFTVRILTFGLLGKDNATFAFFRSFSFLRRGGILGGTFCVSY
jgi:hypothetical protein